MGIGLGARVEGLGLETRGQGLGPRAEGLELGARDARASVQLQPYETNIAGTNIARCCVLVNIMSCKIAFLGVIYG